MIKEEKIQELVHKYTENRLSTEEKADFEHQLQEDTNLASKVKDYQLILKGFQALRFEAFVNLVNQWEKKYQEKRSNSKVRSLRQREFRRYYAVAAVIILFIFPLGYWYMNQPSPYSSEELYAQHFEQYPDLLTGRGDSESGEQNLTSAMEYYNKGYYENAISLFEAYIPTQPDEYLPVLYLGISYLEINDTETALKYFNSIAQNPEYQEMAQWYTALTMIKSNKLEEGKTILTQIAESEMHYQKKKAIEILNTLE